MNIDYTLTLLAVQACLFGCATSLPDGHPREVANVPLVAAPRNLGEVATVSLARKGEDTSFVIVVGGVSPPLTLPARFYTFIYPGSCGKLAANPAYEMNETLVAESMTVRGPWTLHKVAPIHFSELRSGDYALVVRTAPWDGSVDLFCGNLKSHQRS